MLWLTKAMVNYTKMKVGMGGGEDEEEETTQANHTQRGSRTLWRAIKA
ncbi:hypothetical protein [Photobacterium damselae]|nr:hypothetical protein [Photobacterium damselae]